MTRYQVYLEESASGLCMAHILDLPGCHTRAGSRQQALDALPGAIREYLSWLRRYGEPAPDPEGSFELEVAGDATGSGPFDPGDTAALFPLECDPIQPNEMETRFRLMEHARSDLLSLVAGLPGDLLDWRIHPECYTLRRVLRHIGNADQWYVSRIVAPESLPSEWQDDEQMPLYEYLEMSRRTAVERLRALSPEERSGVLYPTRWTQKPGEPWTARKVLRRFLEHEIEHTGQVREILALRRDYLLARLARERAKLWDSVLDLDEPSLTRLPSGDSWTVKEVLSHLAGWDRWEEETMRRMVAGGDPGFAAVQDVDAVNEQLVAPWRSRSLRDVVSEVCRARESWVGWIKSLPIEKFFKSRAYENSDWTFGTVPLRIHWEHDAVHAGQIGAWRSSQNLGGGSPLAVVMAAREAMRGALLSAVALVAPDERESQPVCGHWTLKDVLGHIADWERFGARSVANSAAGRGPGLEEMSDLDEWNEAWVSAGRDRSWDEVLEQLDRAHRELSAALKSVPEAEWGRPFPFPGHTGLTIYGWIAAVVRHDSEHCRDLWQRTDNAT